MRPRGTCFCSGLCAFGFGGGCATRSGRALADECRKPWLRWWRRWELSRRTHLGARQGVGGTQKKAVITRCYLKGQNSPDRSFASLSNPYHLARNFNPLRVGPWEGTRWYLKGHPCREVKRKRNPRQTSLSDIRFCVQASRSPSRNGQRWRFPCFAPCAHMVRSSSAWRS